MILFILIIFLLGFFVFRILSSFTQNKSIVPVHKDVVKIDTFDLVNIHIYKLLKAIKTQDYKELCELCTDHFRDITENFSKLSVNYEDKFSIIIELDTKDEVVALIVGECYDIRNNILKFVRNNDNIRLNEVL